MFPGETILSGGKKEPGTSDFMVLRSAAGWYVGTIFTHDGKTCGCNKEKDGYDCKGQQDPGSRETDYFKTEAEAKKALETYKATGVLLNQRY